MNKWTVLAILFSGLLILPILAQTDATTKDGKKVLLYPDGTWKYAPVDPLDQL